MSDKKRPLGTLNRRQLLAGMTGIGAVGALTGIGTAALLSDRERFEGFLSTGSVDLYVDGVAESQLDVTFDLSPESPTDSKDVVLTLPQSLPGVNGPGGQNNPAGLWLQAECPVLEGPDSGVLYEAISVRLSYCDGSEVLSGNLWEVSEALRDGIPLDAAGGGGIPAPETRDCLLPGGSLCLRIEWTFDNSIAEYVEEQEIWRRAITTYNLQAVQCRHDQALVNPFEESDQCAIPGLAISWFGATGVDPEVFDPNDLNWSVTGWNFSDEPAQISWELSPDAGITQLGHFVIQYGTSMLYFPGGTSGTATVGDTTNGMPPADVGVSSSNWSPSGENGVKWEHAGGDLYEIEPEDQTLAVASPETPGELSTHAISILLGNDVDGTDLETATVEYPADFDLSGVASVGISFDSVDVDPTTFANVVADTESVSVTLPGSTALSSGSVLTLTYGDVSNAVSGGRYPVSLVLETTAGPTQIDGMVTIR